MVDDAQRGKLLNLLRGAPRPTCAKCEKPVESLTVCANVASGSFDFVARCHGEETTTSFSRHTFEDGPVTLLPGRVFETDIEV